MEYWEDLPLSKVLGLVDQSLLDRCVSRQHNHLLSRQVDSEYRAVFFGELKKQREGKFSSITWIDNKGKSSLGQGGSRVFLDPADASFPEKAELQVLADPFSSLWRCS